MRQPFFCHAEDDISRYPRISLGVIWISYGPTGTYQTTVQITSKIEWPRGNPHFYYQNFTVTLHAVDDENLSSIILNDTGTASTFDAHGLIATSTIIITLNGLHALSYYSTDKTGNKE